MRGLRRRQCVDGADERREVDADRRVRNALSEQREHDEARDDEATVIDPADILHPAADRAAEDDEIEAGGDHRRRHRLPQRAQRPRHLVAIDRPDAVPVDRGRSEEHTSELQSLMRISYAVFCLKKKTMNRNIYYIDDIKIKTYKTK